ncbi:tyrosine-type recombinase/integrase [Brevundimonas phoenicis]|uniref:tyrosine-type recombinase/integrase n=1 Tax=Brevundimonas sp. 3P6-tot-D TaxID=3132281 RepID=UPI0039AF36AD
MLQFNLRENVGAQYHRSGLKLTSQSRVTQRSVRAPLPPTQDNDQRHQQEYAVHGRQEDVAVGRRLQRVLELCNQARAKELHFHDLRGTAATRFYRAELTPREIADVMGWCEVRVERLIDRYVKRDEPIQHID